MKTPLFRGAGVAIITPFKQDGSINFDKFAELVEQQIAAGTAAIIVCGTTGETSTLHTEEHQALVRFCVERTAHRIPVIAGCGSNHTDYAIEMGKFCASAGVDGLLMVTPYYNKCSQTGLARHMTSIVEAAGIPGILYNVPSRTGVSFTAETYELLSRHPLINGVKEASGNFDLMAETRHRCGDELCLWSGNDSQVVPTMALGGDGVISVVSNIAPAAMAKVCSLMLAGRTAEAAKAADRIHPLSRDLFLEVNPIPVKTAMNLMGMEVGGFRMPLCEMSPANAEKLAATLRSCGLLR